jgi:hypothetical protein
VLSQIVVSNGQSQVSPKRHQASVADRLTKGHPASGAVKAEADRFAANVLPIIREAQKAGARTLSELADALNARGITTARGGQWYAQTVANVLARS